jgi:hypothetical protein
MTFSSPQRQSAPSAPVPAGGIASPPHDPPAASGRPQRGQQETNTDRAAAPLEKSERSASAAFDFGWQSRLQYGRAEASKNVSFESIEPELEQQWGRLQAANQPNLPWQAARETAKDAWNQVYDAITDSERK